jgi:hypothetical protein
MSDTELMQSIKTKWGTTIDDVCSASSIPPAFLAALVANEDGAHGGDPAAKRFEKLALAGFWQVLMGRSASFEGIGKGDLVAYICNSPGPVYTVPATIPTDSLNLLDGLACSWGLTQIMGWHVFDLGVTVAELKLPSGNLRAATKLLAKFSARFNLGVTQQRDLGELFDAWNTGRPDGATFDPNYVTNGLARMAAYASLP